MSSMVTKQMTFVLNGGVNTRTQVVATPYRSIWNAIHQMKLQYFTCT